MKGRSALDILAKVQLSRCAGERHWLDEQETRLRVIGKPTA